MKKITHRTEMMSIIGKKRIPIRLQFGIFIILFTTALAASILFFTIKGQKEVLVKERTTVGQTLTAHLAAAAKDAILLEDDLYVYDMINDMVKNDAEKDIRYIFVTDSSGKILIHNKTDQLGDTLTDDITRAVIKSTVSSINKTTLNGEAVVDYARPVIENFSRKTIGYARIGISEESINRVVNQSARQMITIAIAVLLIGLAASLFWVRLVTKPVSLLADGAEKIGKGDLKYRFKIEARNELGELAEIFNRMTGDLDLAQQELVAKQRLDHELDLARSLQAALLPDKLPDTEQIDITAWYKAAKQVGGDYYDFINVDDSHLGIVIADVSGKSITGAFMMGITRASMRAIAPGILSPREVLIKLNEQMCANMRKGMFVTMLYLIIDMKTMRIKFASAGHDPLFYKSLGDEKYRLINPNGCAIGVSRGSFASRLEEEELDLKPCDTIALTTDGINEATSKDGTIFGEDKMYTHLSDNECAGPRELLERLTSALTTHYGDSEPSDDATIVILKVKEKKDA